MPNKRSSSEAIAPEKGKRSSSEAIAPEKGKRSSSEAVAQQNSLVVAGNRLIFQGKEFRCAVGKNVFSEHKKEGDNCTPLGIFPLRECWYRADRMLAPDTKLPLHITGEHDGWCDDPADENYNRHILIPSPEERDQGEQKVPHHEMLWREDHVYDLVIPLGYNDDPPIAGLGSAIFMHIAHEDYRGTEGCVALSKSDLLEVLRHCDAQTTITITSA